MSQTNKNRAAHLDVLKAIAIIAVVLYHSGFLTYGYLGVDLFLAINGYLITKGLVKNTLGKDARVSFSGYCSFQLGRVVRLLPALLVACFVCMLLGFFIMLPDDYENLSQSVIASSFFGNNILAAITTKNYWDVANEYKPLMHTWYVGLIMQFYLVYPLLFYMARIDKKTPKKTLLTMVSTLGIISFFIFIGTTNASHRFYYLPSRFFEFAVGGIVALVQDTHERKPFRASFVYICYGVLILLFVLNKQIIPDNIRLMFVVALSCVLIVSSDVLSNVVFSNAVLAKIGQASYSIFIWHQLLLAFWRYTIANHFTIGTYLLYLVVVVVISFVSYRYIEGFTSSLLFSCNGRRRFYPIFIALFLIVNCFAAYIYFNAGVVRDVPELYITKADKHRGMHAEYCDRGFQYDKDFVTQKSHWLVIGNSFGRDFVNAIIESPIVDSVEVSYTSDYINPKNTSRFSNADRVFVSSLGVTDKMVSEIEIHCLANGVTPDRIVVVGEKNFGESNGQIYSKRFRDDYFRLYIEMEDGYWEKNEQLKELFGDRFLDLIGLVSNEEGMVRVFSDDNHYISADTRHFSKGGAIYFGKLIDWSKYLK